MHNMPDSRQRWTFGGWLHHPRAGCPPGLCPVCYLCRFLVPAYSLLLDHDSGCTGVPKEVACPDLQSFKLQRSCTGFCIGGLGKFLPACSSCLDLCLRSVWLGPCAPASARDLRFKGVCPRGRNGVGLVMDIKIYALEHSYRVNVRLLISPRSWPF